MLPVDVKLAFDAIRAARWRSLLTMLGVIIGVAGVVTAVSVGEGVKQQVIKQVDNMGADVITVRPGKSILRNDQGGIEKVNLLRTLTGGATFSDSDYQVIQKTSGVGSVVPIALVNAVATVDGAEYSAGTVYGTSEAMPEVLKQKLLYGGFFDTDDANRNMVVIGHTVAEQLFKQNAPIGRSVEIHGQSFIVAGVLDDFASSPLTPGTDYNTSLFIPYLAAKNINNGQAQVEQLFLRSADAQSVATAAKAVTAALKGAHGGQEDFTVLTQEDSIAVSNQILDVLTTFVGAVAAIALLIGGVGIMNIMLVSVSERTHEIGVRKAIGATSGQVMRQFLIEAVTISFVGGLLGVILSLLANYFLRLLTSLQPAINVWLTLISLGVAVGIGVFFGVAPAMKAARKDPIEALRRS